ncbi:hypothetical protein C8R46DRAFT_1218959 [Mycena filopes]|nr:hypothetical protein C8R46DRAFT_1218959 [Mycena filopes]
MTSNLANDGSTGNDIEARRMEVAQYLAECVQKMLDTKTWETPWSTGPFEKFEKEGDRVFRIVRDESGGDAKWIVYDGVAPSKPEIVLGGVGIQSSFFKHLSSPRSLKEQPATSALLLYSLSMAVGERAFVRLSATSRVPNGPPQIWGVWVMDLKQTSPDSEYFAAAGQLDGNLQLNPSIEGKRPFRNQGWSSTMLSKIGRLLTCA